MITNDDGIDGPGLHAARDALCEAGHDVTVVAPAHEKSGTSASLTSSGTFTVVRGEFPCGDAVGQSWAVDDAFPGDTVLFAVDAVYGGERPDLVVSGINPGPNAGDLTTNSGTVGATVSASNLGVPAIAMSVALRSDIADSAYPYSGQFLVDLVSDLQRTLRRSETLLPRGMALNVNIPGAVGPDGSFDPNLVSGARITTQADANLAQFRYQPTEDPNVYAVAPSGCTPGTSFYCTTPGRGTDLAALDDGFVSITPIDGNYTSPRDDRAQLNGRLRGLR